MNFPTMTLNQHPTNPLSTKIKKNTFLQNLMKILDAQDYYAHIVISNKFKFNIKLYFYAILMFLCELRYFIWGQCLAAIATGRCCRCLLWVVSSVLST